MDVSAAGNYRLGNGGRALPEQMDLGGRQMKSFRAVILSQRIISDDFPNDRLTLISGVRYDLIIPLFYGHNRGGDDPRYILGSVRDIQRDGLKLIGTLNFVDTERGRHAEALVAGQHIRFCSPTEIQAQREHLPHGDETKIGGIRYYSSLPGGISIAHESFIKEVSLVFCPANPDCKILY